MQPRSFRAADASGYLSFDTVAAVSTPVGGAIALIRISGPQAREVIARMALRDEGAHLKPRELRRFRLFSESGLLLDDAMVVWFPGPNTFTGEDLVELHLHGGAFCVSRVMGELIGQGIRSALPGEFSFRAVRNGKMTLSEAEATADLISASNAAAADLALEKMSGSQSRLLGSLADELRQLAALGEIGIDFADQDVDEVSLANLRKRVGPVLSQLGRLRDSFGRGSRIQEGVRVAFVGLPNAGKSSFFNALLGEDRSIVSEIAGTTRDIVRERLTLQGSLGSVTLRLEDTAGLRSSGDEVEKMGIERTQRAAREADVLILLVDASRIVSQWPEVLREWERLGRPAARTLGVLSQTDRFTSADQWHAAQRCVKELGLAHWARVSAVTGEGVSEAARLVADTCQHWVHRDRGEVLLTRQDQLEAVERSIAHLNRALEAPEIDLFASDLRQALLSLTSLIGDTVPDDILGRVFSQFCIGK